MIEEQKILDVLDAIDRGDDQIIRPVLRDRGCIRSETASGWVFWVFDDAGCWDYIESVQPPGGERINLWAYLDRVNGVEIEPDKWKEHPTYAAYERVRSWRPNHVRRWPGW